MIARQRPNFVSLWTLVAMASACPLAAAGDAPAAGGEDWKAAFAKAVRSRDVQGVVGLVDIAVTRRIVGADGPLADAFASPNVWIRRAALRGVVATGSTQTVETLVKALDDSNPLVRLDACVLSARLRGEDEGTTRVADALLGRLSDGRKGVRAAAARSLGQLRAATAYWGLSRSVADDSDADVRAAAVEALGYVGGDGAPHSVRGALEDDEDDRVRATACVALGILRPDFAVAALERAIKDVSGRVRVAATEGLAIVGSEEAVKALVDALALPDEDLRVAATRSLGRIGSSPAIAAMRKLLAHGQPEVRRESAQLLGQYADLTSQEGLARMVRDPDPRVRAAAVEALGRIADPRGAPAVRVGFRDKEAEVRARSAEAAARLGDVASTPEFVNLLRPEFTDGERVAAAAALGAIGDERVGQPLLGLLDDASEPVRRAATAALGRLGLHGRELLARRERYKGAARTEFLGALAMARTPGARAVFEQELKATGANPAARNACEIGLYLLGDRSRRDAVVAGARGERRGANPTISMVALLIARDPAGEETVRAALRSRSPAMRESAAFALGVARPDWAEPLLREATKDRHPGVALRARVGLRWLAARKPAR